MLTALIKGFSNEYSLGLTCAVIGSYTFIGGLGATFYVSYFNTAFIFIIMITFMIRVFFASGGSGLLGNFTCNFSSIRHFAPIWFGHT